jgi:hypothetical protein
MGSSLGDMSLSTAIYLGAAVLFWTPFVLMVGGKGSSRLGRLSAGALLAVGWPLAVPLMVAALSVRRRSRRLESRVIRLATHIPYPAVTAEPVAAER